MWIFDWQRNFTRTRLARKSCYNIKKFEYSPFGKEPIKQTSASESFAKAFEHDQEEEPIKIKIEGPLKSDDSSLFYNNKYSFIEFKNFGKYMDDSCESKREKEDCV